MKQLNWKWTVFLILLCLAIIGLSYGVLRWSEKRINRGLDIAGGLYILMEAVQTGDETVDRDAIERAMAIIRNRIDALDVVEPVLQVQGERRIRIELPGYEDERLAREIIGRTARLSFVGPDGNEILTGAHLNTAHAKRDEYMRPQVALEFDSEGAGLFAAATAEFLGQQISIYLDDELLSSPVVQSVIVGGSAVITGIPSMEEAGHLALMLRSGALPVTLEEMEFRLIGPTLGDRTEEIGVWAAGIGFLGVLLFMLLFYRMAGAIAGISLVLYLGMVMGVLWMLNATLTLPGIAGLILSIGMAVDANVIIFERIKEEMRQGRSLRTALETGFNRAFRTILDANVTTIIAAFVLFMMATGPVRGFAVTLFIGIICSMFVALIITRYLLRIAFRSRLLSSGAYLGVRS